MMYSSAANLMGLMSAYYIAAVLSIVILLCGMRWFVFVKAGQKGWKSLIPIYSDLISYRIAWDGRIFSILLVGIIGASILSVILCLLLSTVGMILSTILLTVVLGAYVLSQMILQFKTARAFGKCDYFAVGMFFAPPVFLAILAFGDAKYQGPQLGDGIGVPNFVNQASAAATAAAQQLHSQQPAQPQPPQQPMMYQQPPMQQPVQQPAYPAQPNPYQQYGASGYPQPAQPHQRRSRSSQYSE